MRPVFDANNKQRNILKFYFLKNVFFAKPPAESVKEQLVSRKRGSEAQIEEKPAKRFFE